MVCRNTVDFCMFNLCSYKLINSRNILQILWRFLDNFIKNKDSVIFPFADHIAFVFCCFITPPEFLALCCIYGIHALFPVLWGGCSLLPLSLMLAVGVCRYFLLC